MDDLRWILLIVVIVVIAIIYFVNRSRKKESSYSPLDAVNDVPSFSAAEDVNNEWVDGVGPVRVMSSSEPNISPASQKENNSEDFSNDYSDEIKPVNEPVIEPEQELAAEPVLNTEHEQDQEPEDIAIDDVISVYVLAADDESINGEKILSASYALQLEHGEMKIFHRYSNAAEKKIQFSMANIQEPGWFDVEEMHQMKTRGVSFFMQVNLVENASEVLSEMLICAHSLSTMLGAKLCNAQQKLLDEACADELRNKVKHLEDIKSNSV